jgi:hypothetical protein
MVPPWIILPGRFPSRVGQRPEAVPCEEWGATAQKRDATSVHGGGGGRNHDSAMAGALGVATKPSFSPCEGCPGPRDEVVFLEWKHWIRATSG